MMQKKIDDAANLWEKTKDPKYKDLWYKYIKEYTNGINNTDRRNVSSSSGDKEATRKRKTIQYSR